MTFKEFNRLMRRENDAAAAEREGDPFGRDTGLEWRPPSPVVAVVDLSLLRHNVKTEHRLRGLETVALPPPGALAATKDSQGRGQTKEASPRVSPVRGSPVLGPPLQDL